MYHGSWAIFRCAVGPHEKEQPRIHGDCTQKTTNNIEIHTQIINTSVANAPLEAMPCSRQIPKLWLYLSLAFA